jgi:hypothetical protein
MENRSLHCDLEADISYVGVLGKLTVLILIQSIWLHTSVAEVTGVKGQNEGMLGVGYLLIRCMERSRTATQLLQVPTRTETKYGTFFFEDLETFLNPDSVP